MKSLARGLLPKKYHLTNRLTHAIWEETEGRVVGGPFKGMAYVETAVGSALIPKILGTYEFELRPCVESVVESAPGNVLILGAAEGYYTVGLARLLTRSRILSWELSPQGRALTAAMLKRNTEHSPTVDVCGFCSVSGLRDSLQTVDHSMGSFILSDIEGAEALLLDPLVLPELLMCDLLVEVHEHVVPGVGSLLRNRFKKTHSIREITARPRTLSDWPFDVCPHASRLWNSAKLALMNERRPPDMSWLHMHCRYRL